jgi:hypothetical protein
MTPMAGLVCVECGCVSEGDARGWKAHTVWADEGPDDEIVFCPECHEREFEVGRERSATASCSRETATANHRGRTTCSARRP